MLGHRGGIRISLALSLATFLLTIGLAARAGGVPLDNAILSSYNDGTRLLQKQEFAQAAEILKPVTV